MACFAETGILNAAMFGVAIVAALIAFASEWIRQWWNRTKISLVFEAPEERRGPFFGCVYWLSQVSPLEDAVWVRMRVKNKKKRLARSCQPFLTTIEKKDKDGKYKVVHRDMLRLHWAFRDQGGHH